MKTTIILARHGQSVWNKKRVLQGCTDSSLTKEGIKQAEALAKKIKNMGVTKIVSSNLKRAVQTAEIIAKEVALNFEKYPRLNERSFGKLEGKSWIEIEKEFEDMSKFFLQTPEGGESQEDFTNRVTGEFKAIISKNYGQTLLLVCHGGTIYRILEDLKITPPNDIKNTSICTLSIEEEIITVEKLGDSSHLENIRKRS